MTSLRRLGTVGALVASLAVGGGCTFRDDFAESTLPPMPVGAGSVAGTVATTAVPDSIDLGPRAPAIVGEDCALTPPPSPEAVGRLTYTFQTRWYELRDDANSASCLRALRKAERGALSWAPSGDRALLGPGLTIDAANKVRRTGIPGAALTPQFSADGSLIVTLEKGQLLRRPAGSTKRTKVSFLAETTAFAVHPSGRVIAAAGTTADQRSVIAMASIDGQGARDLVNLAPGVVVSRLAWTPDGSTVVWVSAGVSHQARTVHLPDLKVLNRLAGQAPMTDLVVGDDVIATSVGSCEQSMAVRISNPETTFDLTAFPPFGSMSTRPIGFLGDMLLIEARAKGCSGAADVWAVDPGDPSSPVLLVSAVDGAAVRPSPRPVEPPPAIVAPAVNA